jgi:hypothetical protein
VKVRLDLALTTRPPGTEFLEAETERQASMERDQNPGSEWPEIPAETPYLASYRKRTVCGDWMWAHKTLFSSAIEAAKPFTSRRATSSINRLLSRAFEFSDAAGACRIQFGSDKEAALVATFQSDRGETATKSFN